MHHVPLSQECGMKRRGEDKQGQNKEVEGEKKKKKKSPREDCARPVYRRFLLLVQVHVGDTNKLCYC